MKDFGWKLTVLIKRIFQTNLPFTTTDANWNLIDNTTISRKIKIL